MLCSVSYFFWVMLHVVSSFFPRWFRERRQVNQAITSPTTGQHFLFGAGFGLSSLDDIKLVFLVLCRWLSWTSWDVVDLSWGVEVEDTDTVESQDAGLPLPSTTLMPLLALQRAHTSVHRGDSILHASDIICTCNILLVYSIHKAFLDERVQNDLPTSHLPWHLLPVVSLWWSWLDHLWVEAIEAYLAHRPELRRGFSKTLSDLQFVLEFHLTHLFADPGTIHNQLLSLGLVKYFSIF